jgi:hypothetical protein
MFSKLVLMAMHFLAVLFFTGMAGCLLVVVISWISILRSGFSKDHPNDN